MPELTKWIRGLFEPNNDGRHARLAEESFLVEQVLHDWGVFEYGQKDTHGEYELYGFPPDFSGLSKHEIVEHFVDFVARLAKTTNIVTDLNDSKAVQYEMLFVLPAQIVGLARDGDSYVDPGRVDGIVNDIQDTLRARFIEELFHADTRPLKPDNLREFLGNRFRIQVYLLVRASKLGRDRFVYLSKRREGGSGAVNFLLSIPQEVSREEEVLMNELSDVVSRNSGQEFKWGAVRTAVYHEGHEFFLCAYPSSKVQIFLSDILGNDEPHQRSKRVRVVNVRGFPALQVTIDDVGRELRKFGGGKLNVLSAIRDVGPIYLRGVSTSFSHYKGNIAFIGYVACPVRGEEWRFPALPHPAEEYFDALRADVINWFPAPHPVDSMQHEGSVNVMVRLATACGERQQELWKELCPLEAQGLFSIVIGPQNKYVLLRQKEINPGTVFRLASRQKVRPSATEPPEAFMRRLLTESIWICSPSENVQDKEQVALGDGIFYLAVGLESLGYYIFELRTASKIIPRHYEAASFQNDFGQSRIFELCERKGIMGLRNANKPTSQGNLFIGRDGRGELKFVKVFYGEQLDGRGQALRKIWRVLSAVELLPPDVQCLRLNQDYREIAGNDRRDSATWVIISPEYRTLDVALDHEADLDERLRWVEGLRAFYRTAINAGLSFIDCSADDLILVGDDGSQILLIDYGSYVLAKDYTPDAEPGKDEHRDPPLRMWLAENKIEGHLPALLKAQHAYNLGLLEFRIWTGVICPVAQVWDLAEAGFHPTFERKYAELLAQAEEYLRAAMASIGVEGPAIDGLVSTILNRLNVNVLERCQPGEFD